MNESHESILSSSIGVLDSGVGGLSVLRHLRRELPNEHFLYFADQAHIPYGLRPQAEIQAFTGEIAQFLIGRGAKLIVVACNTASAAALEFLREKFPDVSIVGMEPAVKPAANHTRTGRVGVLATPGTFNSHRYAALMTRYAAGIEVFEDPCVGLVQLIEDGALDSTETEAVLQKAVRPMIAAGADTLVLGCTHYPFVMPLLQAIVGEHVTIIDPAPAIARHTRNVLQQKTKVAPPNQNGEVKCFTSADPERFRMIGQQLLTDHCKVHSACWREYAVLIDC